ncbi:MAG: RnfABCDGE type electron transport complex subunit D, partial [Eubacteriales bacterium]
MNGSEDKITSDTASPDNGGTLKMPELLTVSPSPHVKAPDTSRTIMLDVCVALFPALVWACYIFGLRALTLTLISVISCVIFEALFQFIMKRPITVLDFSAVVTGILLAFNLPSTVPLWLPIIGAFFAIVIVKQLYGGIGMNVVNPALAARVFLMISFPAIMSVYVNPLER